MISTNSQKDSQNHVKNRRVTVFYHITPELLKGMGAAFCAQDLFQMLNHDMEKPDIEVSTLRVTTNGNHYIGHYGILRQNNLLAIVSVERG